MLHLQGFHLSFVETLDRLAILRHDRSVPPVNSTSPREHRHQAHWQLWHVQPLVLSSDPSLRTSRHRSLYGL